MSGAHSSHSHQSSDLKSATPRWTAKQKLVLETATRLFAQKGYANTSTSEIAKKAGVSEGSIFRRFKTKEGLLLTILSPVIDGILSNMLTETNRKAAILPSLKLRDFVTIIVEDRTEFIQKHIAVFKLLIEAILYDNRIRLQIIKKLPKQLLPPISQVITSLHSPHETVDCDNEEIMRFIGTNVLGSVLNYFLLLDQSTAAIHPAQ